MTYKLDPDSALPLAVIVGTGKYATRCAEIFESCLVKHCKTVLFASPLAAEAAFYDSGSEDWLLDAPVALLVTVIGEDTDSGDDILLPMLSLQIFHSAQVMILSTSLEISGVEGVIEAGRMDWVGYAPDIELDAFVDSARAQIRRFNQRNNYDTMDRIYSVFDQPYTDHEIIVRILERVESSLGAQPRIRIPEGTRLTEPGRWVEEITIVLSGSVALLHQASYGGLVMHEQSTGRIIGLLALSEGRRALLAAVTTSDVVAVRLTVEQFDSAIQGHPDIILLVATLFIRSLDRRLRRAEHLHIKNAELSDQLDRERNHLATALQNLEQARMELTSQQRLASLGSLAAGMAHELNNPSAAIERTSDHLGEDIVRLLSGAPDKKWSKMMQAALRAGLESKALSTRAERVARAELTALTGDAALAQRLVLAGIRDPKVARQISKRPGVSLAQAESAASVGVSLRNLSSASHRITDLVASLRSYARPDGDPVRDVDVHENLDDAIRLLSHKLEGIDLVRDYEDVPPITCYPGELGQVWTNLLTNAAEAIVDEEGGGQGGGRIVVRTSQPRLGLLRVEVIDDGPGIPPEILERIFEPRFTTKSGQMRFGMGIGMGLVRTIVDKHGGDIRIETSPKGTDIVVELPISGFQEDS